MYQITSSDPTGELELRPAHLPALAGFEKRHTVDVALHRSPVPCNGIPEPVRPVQLAVFDLDSTLIGQEVIDEIARTVGVSNLVSQITAAAMRGEYDFKESLIARVALLKGTKANVWEDVKKTITFTPGAKELCRVLRKLNVRMAVISGGFTPIAYWVKDELGLDYAFANQVGKVPWPRYAKDITDMRLARGRSPRCGTRVRSSEWQTYAWPLYRDARLQARSSASAGQTTPNRHGKCHLCRRWCQ